jgi:hypothetical protein
MDRRQALRNLGLGAGAMVATPTVVGLLQSCKSEPDFVPVFLSPGEGYALKHMVELIIPSDETIPGAVDIGAHEFIDSYWNEVTPKIQGQIWKENYEPLQEHIRMFFKLYADDFRTTFKKELEDGEAEEFDQMLSKYLKTSKEEQLESYITIAEFYEEYEEDSTVVPDSKAAIFNLIAGIRGMTIWAWKSSEQIGENVLWYDPIPSKQIGCIPLDEAGNGNAMAL